MIKKSLNFLYFSSTLRILGPRNLRFFLKEENLKDQFF